MITLTDTEATLLKSNLKSPFNAEVGDYLVRIVPETLYDFQEHYEDSKQQLITLYYLHRVTRKTKSSLYTGGHIGDAYWRWSPVLEAGNTLEVLFPLGGKGRVFAPSFLEDHIVREIANNRDLGRSFVFKEIGLWESVPQDDSDESE